MLDPTKAMGHRSWLTLCYTNIAIETGRLKLIYQLTIVIFQFAMGLYQRLNIVLAIQCLGLTSFGPPKTYAQPPCDQRRSTAQQFPWPEFPIGKPLAFHHLFLGLPLGTFWQFHIAMEKNIMLFCR